MPVFLGFRPEIDPVTPLNRRGSPGTSICTKNQPRRPLLRPFRGHFIFWVPGGPRSAVARGELGSLAGYLKAVGVRIFGPVFLGFRPDGSEAVASSRSTY